MAAHDRDDETFEIRRQNKTKPTIVAVVIVAVVTVLFVRDPGGSFEGDPVTTTQPISEQTTTTEDALATPATTRPVAPEDLDPLRALAVQGDRVLVLTSRPESLRTDEAAGIDVETASTATHAVATEELLAVLGADGEVLVAGDDAAFRAAGCCYSDLIPSNEPRHVWAFDPQEGAVLIDLRNRIVVTELGIGTRIAGPAVFGLVSRDFDATASWVRPGFDPVSVQAPPGRRPRAAGGIVVAFAVEVDAVEAGSVEARRLADGALVRAFNVPGNGPVAVALSPIGDAIALSRDAATVAVDVESGAVLGDLDASADVVVSIGQGRFAALVGDEIIDSTGRSFGAFAGPVILATRAE